jgi:EAL domain-containing protein (putative c-di-GMP-specific phosphodiesterase class I)
MISPLEFIPIAEGSGKIIPLGEQVFDKVLSLFDQHHIQDYGIDYIEVNLSPLQVRDPTIVERFHSIMEKHDVSPSHINFEITESSFIDNPTLVLSIMNQFIQEGFAFSLDDFGTGYSNFHYLYDMKFKIIKLDKSILDKASDSAIASKTLFYMIEMLKDISFQVLQEGVERQEQEEKLFEYGIDYIQGFYHSKPLPEEEFLSYMKQS